MRNSGGLKRVELLWLSVNHLADNLHINDRINHSKLDDFENYANPFWSRKSKLLLGLNLHFW